MITFDSSSLKMLKERVRLYVDVHLEYAGGEQFEEIAGFLESHKDQLQIPKYGEALDSDCKVWMAIRKQGSGDLVTSHLREMQWASTNKDTGTRKTGDTKYSETWASTLKSYICMAFNLISRDDVALVISFHSPTQSLSDFSPADEVLEQVCEVLCKKPPYNMSVMVSDAVLAHYAYRVFTLNGVSDKKKYGVLHQRDCFPTYLFGVGMEHLNDSLITIVPLADDYYGENGRNCKTFRSNGEDLFNLYGFAWVQLGASRNGNRIDWRENKSPLMAKDSVYRTKRGVSGDGHIKGWGNNDELAKHTFYKVRASAYKSNNEAFTKAMPLVYISGLVDGSEGNNYLIQALTNTTAGYTELQRLACLALMGGPVINRICRSKPGKVKSIEVAPSLWEQVGIAPSIYRSTVKAIYYSGVRFTFETVKAEEGEEGEMATAPTLELITSPWRVQPGVDGIVNFEGRKLVSIEGKGPYDMSWTSKGWDDSRAEFNAKYGYSIDDKADASSAAQFVEETLEIEGRGLGSIAIDKNYRHTREGYRISIEKKARGATAACPIMSFTDCSFDNADVNYRARKVVFANKSAELNLTDWLGLDSDKTAQLRAQWDY